MSGRICTYWQGPVSWLERLCVASMVEQGYEVEVFTNDVAALKAQGLHSVISDVRDVLPLTSPGWLYIGQPGGIRVFSDIARLAMLKHDRGVWADPDCYFQGRLTPREDHVFGWMSDTRIANGLLYLPPGSAVLDDYYSALSTVPLRAKWVNIRLRIEREWEILTGGAIPRHAGRSSVGPRALTWFLKKHGLERLAVPIATFYPVSEARTRDLIDPDDRAARDSFIDETVVVHAWQSTLRMLGALAAPPPPSSFLGQQLSRLRI